MRDLDFIVVYAHSCVGGKLPLSECGPAWQMIIIVVLLLLAVSMLVALRFRSGTQPSRA
jgi:hypothetical protein